MFLFRALAIRILVSRVLKSGPVHSETGTSLKNPKAHSIRTNTLQGDRGAIWASRCPMLRSSVQKPDLDVLRRR